MKYLIIFIIRFILLILKENCTNNFEWNLENIPYISIEYIEKKLQKLQICAYYSFQREKEITINRNQV